MNTSNNGNTNGVTIVAALLIILMSCISVYFFLDLINKLFTIHSDGAKIHLKYIQEENASPHKLLILFGFIGSLGSLIRVIYDFIGNTCYTKNFNFFIWWPWYFFRPVLGFILGLLFVILFNDTIVDFHKPISNFPFILSFIVGFAITDAVGFLRRFSKRLFGDTDSKGNSQ